MDFNRFRVDVTESPIKPVIVKFNHIPSMPKVLSFCYNTARKAAEITEYLELSDSSYFRKKILENLVEHNYLEKDKAAGTNYYKSNRDMVGLG